MPDNREVELINKWKELDTVHVSSQPGVSKLPFPGPVGEGEGDQEGEVRLAGGPLEGGGGGPAPAQAEPRQVQQLREGEAG